MKQYHFKMKILSIFLLLGFLLQCNYLPFLKKDEKNQLLTLLSLYKYQRPSGVYISGTLVDADGNPLANREVTITGRGENATIVRSGGNAVVIGGNITTAGSKPEGFYAGALSITSSGTATVATNSTNSNGNPSTLISGFTSITAKATEYCGSTVTGLSATYDGVTANVICDSSSLATAASNVGINSNVQTSGIQIAKFTTNEQGKFTSIFSVPSTGNTYKVEVNGISKYRRLRIARSGTGTLLGASDLLISTAVANTTEEGAGTTANPFGFSIFNLSVELEYPRNLILFSGTLEASETIPAGAQALLQGTVIIPSGVTLTIEPGVTLFGSTSPGGALLVKPGGKLIAIGTSANPIVFTSEKSEGSRQAGDWQGIILQGKGIQTFGGYGATAVGEGDVGTFGGSNNEDSSGTLKYVRIEFAGAPFSPGNERNCLSMMGLGSGTTLEYVQCHRGYDDGFEWWGGAPTAKYLISSSNRDDYFDFADGFIGKVQYAIALGDADPIRSNDDTSRCIEGDGNSINSCSGSARSGGNCADAYFANVTCAGPTSGTNLGQSIFLRRSAGNKIGDFGNNLIDGFTNPVHTSSSNQTSCGIVQGTYVSTRVTTSNSTACASVSSNISGTSITNTSVTSPDFSPSVSNTGITPLKTLNSNFNSSFFDNTTFYGAVEFGGTRWWEGWTSFPAN